MELAGSTRPAAGFGPTVSFSRERPGRARRRDQSASSAKRYDGDPRCRVDRRARDTDARDGARRRPGTTGPSSSCAHEAHGPSRRPRRATERMARDRARRRARDPARPARHRARPRRDREGIRRRPRGGIDRQRPSTAGCSSRSAATSRSRGGHRVGLGRPHRRRSRCAARLRGPSIVAQLWGLATSSTTVRRWPTDRGEAHHIIDPRTALPATTPWRTVSVAPTAASPRTWRRSPRCSSGPDGAGLARGAQLHARLVRRDGTVAYAGGLAGGQRRPHEQRQGALVSDPGERRRRADSVDRRRRARSPDVSLASTTSRWPRFASTRSIAT